MMASCSSHVVLFLSLLLSTSVVSAFVPTPTLVIKPKQQQKQTSTSFGFMTTSLSSSSSSTTSLLRRYMVPKEEEEESVVTKVQEMFKEKPAKTDYDVMVTDIFPGALSNDELEERVVTILQQHGFTSKNTLLATSLCCDELARRLEDDFVKVYGNNFNLGGLSGFPFAGNTGFGAMAAHIPDDGSCLIVYGPHVGVATSGQVGKVERAGIDLVDNCCGSAIAASGYLEGITSGGATITTKIQEFTDFQQGAVQELILPHGKRLADAGDDRMVELPFALYDSQDLLMADIIQKGCGGIKKNGLAVLGGIQINTAPWALDYYLPLRFDYMDNTGKVLENLLPELTATTSS